MVYLNSSHLNVIATVGIDENIPWHKHDKPHTHMPIINTTKVEVEGEEPMFCVVNKTVVLEANKRHRITCIEPSGTMYLNMIEKGSTTESG